MNTHILFKEAFFITFLCFVLHRECASTDTNGEALILLKQKPDYPHLQHLLDEVIQTDLKQPKLLVILCSSIDFYTKEQIPHGSSQFLYTEELQVRTQDKQVYIYRISEFLDLYMKDFISNEMYKKTDIVMIMDDVPYGRLIFPIVLKSSEQVYVLVTRPSMGMRFEVSPSSILIRDKDSYVSVIYVQPDTACSHLQISKEYFILKNEPTLKHMNPNVSNPVSKCEVSLMFSLYSMMGGDWNDQVDYIRSHYLYKFFKQIGKDMKFHITVVSYSTRLGRYSVDEDNNINRKLESFNNLYIFNDNHYNMIGKPYVSKQVLSEMLLYFATEDVVWIVINGTRPQIIWQYVVYAILIYLILFILACVVSSVVNHYFTIKSNGGDFTLLLWSILLSVSIPKQPKHYFMRTMFLSWVLTSSVFTMCYFCTLLDILTNPNAHRVRDQDELVASDIPLYTFSEDYAYIAFGNKSDGKHIQKGYQAFFGFQGTDFLQGKRNITFIEQADAIVKTGKQCAFLLDLSIAHIIMKKNKDSPFYYLPEPVLRYPLHFYGTMKSNFSITIFKKIKALIGGGIVDYLVKEFHRSHTRKETTYAINLTDFYSIYIFMGSIYSFAFLVFLCEILVSKLRKNILFRNCILKLGLGK